MKIISGWWRWRLSDLERGILAKCATARRGHESACGHDQQQHRSSSSGVDDQPAARQPRLDERFRRASGAQSKFRKRI